MRRAIAARLAESNREAPVFQIRGSARVDALLALRKQLNAATAVKISVNDLVVAAAARTHAAMPEMNAIWTPDAVRRFRRRGHRGRRRHRPRARDAGACGTSANCTVSSIAAGERRPRRPRPRPARSGRTSSRAARSPSPTSASFGTEDFTAVINPPQAAILAVGAARQEAVVTDGELGVATVLRVTLSVDHRPVDGATAARWMVAFLALARGTRSGSWSSPREQEHGMPDAEVETALATGRRA